MRLKQLTTLTTQFKNAVLWKAEYVFKNRFQFHTHSEQENIFRENMFYGKKNRVFNQQSQISEIFQKCILITKGSTF